MRRLFPSLLLALLLAAAPLSSPAPALAWEAIAGPICELVHDDETASVRLTYDPAIPEYSIAITVERQWPGAPVFAMRFDGPRGNTISTNRHMLSDGGATLTVTDSGFGNVLNGLEFNRTAIAATGDRAVVLSLADAAPAVQAFRACAAGLSV